MMFSYDEGEEGAILEQGEKAIALIKEIIEFNRNYKRKPKRFRKLGAPNLDMLDNIDSEEVRQRIEQKDEESQDNKNNMAASFSLGSFKCNFQEEEPEPEKENSCQ